MAAPVAPTVVAGFLAVLALIVLGARPLARRNQVFATLLLFQGAVTFTYALARSAATAEEALVYARLAVWYTIPYPMLVVALGCMLAPTHRRRVLERLAIVAGVALSVAFLFLMVRTPTLLVAGVVPTGGGAFFTTRSGPFLYALNAAGFLAGAFALERAARAASSAVQTRLERKQAALVGLAFLFLLSHSGAAYALLILTRLPILRADLLFMLVATTALVGLVVSIMSVRRLVSPFDATPRRAVLTIALLPFVVGALDGALSFLAVRGVVLIPGYDNSILIRRAAFAAAIALALVRYGLSGFGDAARERVARIAQATLALSVAGLFAGLVLAALGLSTAGLVAAPLVGLAAVAASPVPLRTMSERIARRLLVDPRLQETATARARAYSLALREALRRGRVDSDAHLIALRQELHMTDAEHGLLLAALMQERAPDQLLGRYLVERELGRGASATAVLAHDPVTGQRVVLKRFHAVAGHARTAFAEAQALGALRHPRVVPLLDVERVGSELFLVLGYAEGGSARDLLAREGPLDCQRAIRLTREVLDGLGALHQAGMVHRDVKAENVLLDGEGRALLADFGAARFTRRASDITVTGGAVAGSLATLAPEALRGQPVGPAADIYAAAAVLYRLVTGQHYVDLDEVDAFAARERILMDAPRLPHPRVPAALEPILVRALAKRPQDRYGSAAEMEDALARASAASG